MWTIDQDNYLIANYPTANTGELAKHLGRTVASVMSRAVNKFNLRKINKNNKNLSTWTELEIEYIKDNYSKYGIRMMAKELKRSETGVTSKLIELGIHAVKPKKCNVGNKNGKYALTEIESENRLSFMKMMINIKKKVTVNSNINIDLGQLSDAYRLVVG